ncbi:MAG: T9SS type A sorting domain-containing protein, partial [Salibacteraceae bacterium]
KLILSKRMRWAAKLAYVPGVDIVFDPNKENWTRCPVFEAEDNAILTEGGVVRGELRRGLSVDKDGRNQLDDGVNLAEATMDGEQVLGSKVADLRQQDKNYFASLGIPEAELGDYSFGMGWFPGYAVDVETGERLNMAFSENSWLGSVNGADMLWNPTSRIVELLFGELRLGGMHMIYVFRSNKDEGAELADPDLLMPAYDDGNFMFNNLVLWDPTSSAAVLSPSNPINQSYMAVMRAATWVGYPLLAENASLFGESGENKAKVSLRTAQPYTTYSPSDDFITPSTVATGETYYVSNGRVTVRQEDRVPQGDSFIVNIVQRQFFKGQSFTAIEDGVIGATQNIEIVETINKGLPLYNFNTFNVAPTFSEEIGKDALDEIKAVPNPYYAYNEYEQTRLEYKIKVINLPPTCTISIFTVNGTLVRTFRKDDATSTSIDWDLKNQDNITVASGLYIIHIEVPGLGEKVIKWFGVLRPIDLNSF